MGEPKIANADLSEKIAPLSRLSSNACKDASYEIHAEPTDNQYPDPRKSTQADLTLPIVANATINLFCPRFFVCASCRNGFFSEFLMA